MAFNIGIGNAVIASQTSDGIPYMWSSGDVSTPPTFVGVLTGFQPWTNDSNSYYMSDRFGWDVDIGNGTIVVGAPFRAEDNYTSGGIGTFRPGGVYVFDIDGNPVGLASRVHSYALDNSRYQLGYRVAVGSGKIAATSIKVFTSGNDASGTYPAVPGEQRMWYLDGTGGTSVQFGNSQSGDIDHPADIDIAFGKLVIGDTYDDTSDLSAGGHVFTDYQIGGEVHVKGIISSQYNSSYVHHNPNTIFGIAVGGGTTLGKTYSGILTPVLVAGSELGYQVAAHAGMYFATSKLSSSSDTRYLRIMNYDGYNINSYEGHSSHTSGFDKVEAGCGRVIWGGQREFRIYGINSIFAKEIDIYSLYGKYIIDMAIGSGRIGISISSSTGWGYQEEVLIYDLDGNLIDTISRPSDAGGRWFGKSLAIKHGRIVIGAPDDDTFSKISGKAYLYKTPEVINFYDLVDMHGKF